MKTIRELYDYMCFKYLKFEKEYEKTKDGEIRKKMTEMMNLILYLDRTLQAT